MHSPVYDCATLAFYALVDASEEAQICPSASISLIRRASQALPLFFLQGLDSPPKAHRDPKIWLRTMERCLLARMRAHRHSGGWRKDISHQTAQFGEVGPENSVGEGGSASQSQIKIYHTCFQPQVVQSRFTLNGGCGEILALLQRGTQI